MDDTSTTTIPIDCKPNIQIKKRTVANCKHIQHNLCPVLISPSELCCKWSITAAASPTQDHRRTQRAKAIPAIAAAPIIGIAVAIAIPLDEEALLLLPPAVEEL
jgi:hypothetical protein